MPVPPLGVAPAVKAAVAALRRLPEEKVSPRAVPRSPRLIWLKEPEGAFDEEYYVSSVDRMIDEQELAAAQAQAKS